MNLPDFDLSGRVALITGAARGIGLAIVKGFAAAGAAVVIQDIDAELAECEATKIVAAGGRAIGIGGDATDFTQAGIWIEKTVAAFGGLHILVNNASVQASAAFTDWSIDDMRRIFEANVHLLMRLCQLAIPPMQKEGWGRILNIGSIQGRNGNATMAPYSMSKAAIANLTSGLARQYGRDGITVNCLAPGWFNTYRNRADFQTADQRVQIGKHLPLGRGGEPEDCVGPALLLCSRAGSYMTGQTIYVDGGMSA